MAGMQACSLLKSKRYIEGALGVQALQQGQQICAEGAGAALSAVVSWEQRHHVHEHTPALQNSMVMLQTDAQHCCV